MKKIFTLIILLAAGWQMASGQACVPNPNFTGVGIDPDSATNFAPGYANSPYSQLVTIRVPQDTQVLPPPIPPLSWDSTVMVSMTGLPPGFTYNCWNAGPGNQSRCSWRGNTVGCAIITGNPTINDTGTYNLTINTQNYVGGSTSPINYIITYYKIVINAPSSVGDNNAVTFEVLQNYPNPFSDKSEVSFTTANPGVAEVKIFNVVGTQMTSFKLKAKHGLNRFTIDSKGFNSGIYMYSITCGDKTITKRMVVSH